MSRLTDTTKQVNMREATEDRMMESTVEEFKDFILENGMVEEDDDETSFLLPSNEEVALEGNTYNLRNGDEFFVANNGRVFYILVSAQRYEVIEDEEVTLSGTPKQIKFAEDIIKRTNKSIDRGIARLEKLVEAFRGDKDYQTYLDVWHETKDQFTALIEETEEARTIIEGYKNGVFSPMRIENLVEAKACKIIKERKEAEELPRRVTLKAFTGMVIGEYDAKRTPKGYKITLKDGRTLEFDFSGNQIDPTKYSNWIEFEK